MTDTDRQTELEIWLGRLKTDDMDNVHVILDTLKIKTIRRALKRVEALDKDLANGWVLVPSEPTQAMKNEAMQNAFELWEEAGLGDSAPSTEECGTIYTDMLSGVLFSNVSKLEE